MHDCERRCFRIIYGFVFFSLLQFASLTFYAYILLYLICVCVFTQQTIRREQYIINNAVKWISRRIRCMCQQMQLRTWCTHTHTSSAIIIYSIFLYYYYQRVYTRGKASVEYELCLQFLCRFSLAICSCFILFITSIPFFPSCEKFRFRCCVLASLYVFGHFFSMHYSAITMIIDFEVGYHTKLHYMNVYIHNKSKIVNLHSFLNHSNPLS